MSQVRVHLEVWVHLEVRPGLALARCGRLWLAAAGSGQLRLAVVRPSLAKLLPGLAVLQPDLARCGRPCTFALVQLSEVHLFTVIPIFVYLQVNIPTKLVEPH
jgi:hypothetical protein